MGITNRFFPAENVPNGRAALVDRLFEQMKCAACHAPLMFTGARQIAALAHRPVPLFSDLLPHEMGALGDGIEQGDAKAREMRTASLWEARAAGLNRDDPVKARVP